MDQDITPAELKEIHDDVEKYIAENGVPTEEELLSAIEAMNAGT